MSHIVEGTAIRNWQRRPDGITTSGRLTEIDLDTLRKIGIKHVINLALDDHPEALTEEAALLDERDIAYTHIPVPFDAPTREHVRALETALTKSDGPTHVHCIMNYRVTAFFYLIDQKNGMTESDACALMMQVWNPLEGDDPRVDPWKALLTS